MKIYLQKIMGDKLLASISGMKLAKKAISNNFEIKYNDIKIERTKNGKPYVENNMNIFFNISHSERMVVCAVSNLNVGIDIEKIKNRNFISLGKVFCTEKQYRYLKGLSKEKQKIEFYKIWTAKESFSKLIGEGVNMSYAKLEIIDNCITFNNNSYYLKYYFVEKEYIMCVCYI